jgi:carbamoylphosphate synthase large subunit
MTTVLVSGVGGPTGSSLAQLLLARGFDVVGTDMRAVDFPGRIFYLVPAARHPNFLESIDEVIAREKADLFVPTVSEELPVVASDWRGIPAVISPAQAVTIADDKYLTACALLSAGVPAPKFALPSHLHSAAEVGDKIGWPCNFKASGWTRRP